MKMTLEWHKSEIEMTAYRLKPDSYISAMIEPVIDALGVSSYRVTELDRKTVTDADKVITFTMVYEVVLGS